MVIRCTFSYTHRALRASWPDGSTSTNLAPSLNERTRNNRPHAECAATCARPLTAPDFGRIASRNSPIWKRFFPCPPTNTLARPAVTNGNRSRGSSNLPSIPARRASRKRPNASFLPEISSSRAVAGTPTSIPSPIPPRPVPGRPVTPASAPLTRPPPSHRPPPPRHPPPQAQAHTPLRRADAPPLVTLPLASPASHIRCVQC